MTVRVAVIGCGAVARRFHLPAFHGAGLDAVAFASGSRASAEAARAEWGSGDVCDDWREAISRSDIDAVDVCAPNHLHAEIAIAASRAGKHVLVEKPIARTVAEADEMIAAAREAGVLLVPAHNVRFAPPFAAARDAIAAGTIGDVVGFRVAFGHAGPAAWAPGAGWFFDPARAGGGALLDLGVHVADLLRSVLGDEISEVSAMCRRPDSASVETSAHVVMRARAGAIGGMHVSWEARPGPDHQLTVFGTGGTLHMDQSTPLVVHPDGGDPRPVPVPASIPNVYEEFARAIATGTLPVVAAEDGRAALAIVEAAYRSAETGRIVQVCA